MFFCFHIWSIAKFGKIFMWIFTSLATSQNWKEEKKKKETWFKLEFWIFEK
jgi:hypothetical protein